MVKLEAHEWIRERREDKGIRQADVEEQTAALGPRHRVSQSHLSKIEKGRAPLIGLGPERMDALRRVLGLSPEEWTRGTGLQIVAPTSDPHPASAAALGYDVPDTPPEIPDTLLEAGRLYGDTPAFAGLRDPRWQRFLADLPYKNGPRTPEAWLERFVEAQGKYEPR